MFAFAKYWNQLSANVTSISTSSNLESMSTADLEAHIRNLRTLSYETFCCIATNNATLQEITERQSKTKEEVDRLTDERNDVLLKSDSLELKRKKLEVELSEVDSDQLLKSKELAGIESDLSTASKRQESFALEFEPKKQELIETCDEAYAKASHAKARLLNAEETLVQQNQLPNDIFTRAEYQNDQRPCSETGSSLLNDDNGTCIVHSLSSSLVRVPYLVQTNA